MGFFDSLFGKKDKKENIAPQNDLLTKIEVVPGLNIPKAFALEWDVLGKSKLSAIAISATPQEDLSLEQSKFGHYPCIPLNFEYPKDTNENYMYPLAQINFKEIPHLQGYPDAGYLQFYISVSDEMFGIDFDNPQLQKNFKVFYFEETDVEKYKADFSFLDEILKTDMSPVYKPHALSFSLQDEYIGIGDVRSDEFNINGIAKKYPDIEDELEDALYDEIHTTGHKIGGYAHFAQEDPRNYKEEFKEYVLLLQIDTDDNIMWGDSGVGNFFIHPDDLAKKDFSKVLYNWDCY